MSTSTIIFLSAVGCGLLFAGAGWIAEMGPEEAPIGYGKKSRKKEPGTPPRRRRPRWVLPVLTFVGCTAFGGLAFLIDDGVANTTLYEIEADGTGASAPETFLFETAVEHPGVQHSLLVAPLSESSVDGPVDLRVRVIDSSGKVLVNEPETVETRCEAFCEWHFYSTEFTPSRPGPLTVEVTVGTPDVPILHVRVEDPEKTDGKRAPGY